MKNSEEFEKEIDVFFAGLGHETAIADIAKKLKSSNKTTLTRVLAKTILLNQKTNASNGLMGFMIQGASTIIEELPAKITKENNVNRASHAADALHNQVGGSREKQEIIRNIWAGGKYSARDICAEQECAGLGMSFSAARKALRNTPDPT